METRKIQKVGGGTYTVSLPKEWAESENVDAGTVVGLRSHLDGVLVVQARDRETDTGERVRVPVGDDPEWAERLLRAAYTAGVEAVDFDTSDGECRRRIERVARDLTGATVAETTGSRVAVRTPLDPGEVSIRQSVRQLRFVALSMHRDATAVLTDGADTGLRGDRDDQADRLCALIERHVERGLGRLDEIDALGLTRPELFALWGTARELERVADHAQRIATAAAHIDEPSPPVATEVADLAETARTVVDEGVTVVLGDAGHASARHALSCRDRVRADARRLDRRLLDSKRDGRYLRILDAVRRTAEHGGNVAERGLRTAIRHGDVESGATDAQSEPSG